MLSKTVPRTTPGAMSGRQAKSSPSTSSTRLPTSWIADSVRRRIAPGMPTRSLPMGARMYHSRTIQRPLASSAQRTSPRARSAPAMVSPVYRNSTRSRRPLRASSQITPSMSGSERPSSGSKPRPRNGDPSSSDSTTRKQCVSWNSSESSTRASGA